MIQAPKSAYRMFFSFLSTIRKGGNFDIKGVKFRHCIERWAVFSITVTPLLLLLFFGNSLKQEVENTTKTDNVSKNRKALEIKFRKPKGQGVVKSKFCQNFVLNAG